MDMFNNLKGLLHSTNLLGSSGGKDPEDPCVNFDAGADILTHFQKQWEELHQVNEDNAEAATKLAGIIAQVHTHITAQNSNIVKIQQLLCENLQDNITNCIKQINELYDGFENVEEALELFEDLIEKCELEQKKREHRQQLMLYKEKKLANLELLRSELASKHAQNLDDYELKQKKTLQERQNVFQEAFKSDMETYKSLGTLPKIEVKQSNQTSALLEEIQLDVDDEELNKFLEEM